MKGDIYDRMVEQVDELSQTLVERNAEIKRLREELTRIRAITEGALWPSSALAGDAE